jgi:hypothetical protein
MTQRIISGQKLIGNQRSDNKEEPIQLHQAIKNSGS